jgi:hypothetical protein
LLSIVTAFVHLDHDSRTVSLQFITRLKLDGWLVSNQTITFTNFGDSVADNCRLIVAVHSYTEEKCSPQVSITPPPIPTNQLSSYLWAPFNRPESALLYSQDDKSFNNHAFNDRGLPPLVTSNPPDSHNAAAGDGISIQYSLHRIDANPTIKPGSYVVNTDGLCPCFEPCDNSNIFHHHFGIEFNHKGNNYVSAISPFEFACCFNLDNDITYKLSHQSNTFCLDAAIQLYLCAYF